MFSETGRKHKTIAMCEEIPIPRERHDLEFWSKALNKPWREKNWYERFRESLRIVFGCGDDIVTVLASAIVPKKVEWLWPNRVPLGKLTLFVGDPDNGKSMVATYVAATVSNGGDWFDVKNSVPSGEVLIFASEDDPEDTTVPRLMAAGANLDKVHFGKMQVNKQGKAQEEREMRLDADIEAIKNFLDKNPNVRFVVVDPVSNYLGEVDINKEQEVRRALSPLQKLAAENSVAIIGIMHLNKKGDLKAINRVGGAMAFVGVARAVWVFCRDKENADEFQMISVKKNIGKRSNGLRYEVATRNIEIDGEKIPQPFIDWLGETDRSANDVLASKPVGRPGEREKASEWLKQFLSKGPKPSIEVAFQCGAAGLKYRTLERVKDNPGSGVEAYREGEKWYWRLTD